MNPAEMNTSSFHLLQQQVALVQQAEQQPGIVVSALASEAQTSLASNGIAPPATASTSGLPTVDHCNQHGGFHDGLMDVMVDNEENYIDDVSELTTPHGSALQSRMSPDKLSPEEELGFSDLVEQNNISIYLYIRNNILMAWYQNPRQQLTFDEAVRYIESPFNSDRVLVGRVFHFLERQGYINFGIFKVIKENALVVKKPKIVVIGAGIAGLIAARQLKYYGFDVFVLESRNRIGGRVCTYKQGKYIADVGATVITGLGGNPLRVLEKQITMKLKRVHQKCPLYYKNQFIDKTKDEVLETIFNNLLEGTTLLSHRMNFNQIGGKSMSLGEALDIVIDLQEREVKQKYLKHLNDIQLLEEKLSENLGKLKELQESITTLYEKHKEYTQSRTQRSVKQEYAFRVNRLQLNQAIELHTKTEENVKRIEEKISELESIDLPRQYLSPEDRRILDWHFANLEYATATSLNNLSVQHWDQDDDNQFTGPQLAVKNGYSCIPYALADNVDVRLNSVVRSVKMVTGGVEVQSVNIEKYNHMYDSKGLAKKLATAPATTFVADAVLCTLPLGVLKNSVISRAQGEDPNPNHIEFHPPLPDYKVGAIKRLGYGNLNKVVLIFDSVFWDKNIHLFGHVASTLETRGELFLFWSVYKQPVLMALIAGEAANMFERVNDEIIKEKVLEILRGIYQDAVTNLKSYYVTRWKSDPWSLGSYSYVAIDSSGDDYDLMAEAVVGAPQIIAGTQESVTVPRLFFAGEHTIREYPATVHGALLSGVREATKIANQFLGIPYHAKSLSLSHL